MHRKMFLIFCVLTLKVSLAQKNIEIKAKSLELFDQGKFEKSLELLSKIKNKKALESTNVNLYKRHIQSIINDEYFSRRHLKDSLYLVSFKTKFLKNQGIYDTRLKKYCILPIYDSITPCDFKKIYFVAKKNNEKYFINRNGKIVLNFSDYIPNTETEAGNIYAMKVDDNKDRYFTRMIDSEGNILLDSLYYDYNGLTISHCYQRLMRNGQFQIVDTQNKKIILDSLDFYSDQDVCFHNNEIIDVNSNAKSQQFAFAKQKKNNIIYHNINNQIVRTEEFDTYIHDSYENSGYFYENIISDIINSKKNATIKEGYYYDDDIYIIVKKNKKFGIYNLFRNNFYKEPIYDSITPYGNTFYNNKCINLVYGKEVVSKTNGVVFKENNKFGLMNIHGDIIANANYDEIINLNYDSLFLLNKNKKWGFISTKKNAVLVEPKYDGIEIKRGYINAYLNKKVKEYSLLGLEKVPNVLGESKQKYYYSFSDLKFSYNPSYADTRCVLLKQNGLFGLADYEQKEIVPAIYTSVKLVCNKLFVVTKKDSIKGLIDEKGKILIPVKYNYIGCNSGKTIKTTSFDNTEEIYNLKGQKLYSLEKGEFIVETKDIYGL